MTQRGCLWCCWFEEEVEDTEASDDEVLITFKLMAEDIMSTGSMSMGNLEALGGSPNVCLKSRM
jgi:hypothetical protein